MSYLVLARRWRPTKFSELVGQPHVAKTLLNGIRKGRIAHAYLFSGPRGVGKTTTARLLARAINCKNRVDDEPCGVCENCVAISEGHSIDVIEIDAASNRGIDDIKQLRESIRYAPLEGFGKVYIIDEVHMLTNEAFNALLKTLEEPPEHAYFCLATTAPQKVPATILSRCQRFDFRRVSAVEIQAHLVRICKEDKIEFDDAALELIARKADGSLRDSLSLLDQVIAFTDGAVKLEDTVEVVGEIKYDLYFKALDLVKSRNAADAFGLARELAASGADPQDYLAGLQSHLMKVLQVRAGGIDALDLPPEYRQAFTDAAVAVSEADLVRLLQYCAAAETDIRRNFDARNRLQLLLVKFAAFESSVLLSELIRGMESGSAPAPKTHNPKPTTQNPPPTTHHPKPASQPSLSAAQESWDAICDRVAREHNSTAKVIKYGGYPMEFQDGELIIHFSKSSYLNTAKSIQPALAKAVSAALGDVRLDLRLGEVPSRGEEVAPEDDPELRLLQEKLNAKLVN